MFSSHLIHISEFDYELPQEKIATFPLENRDAAKLLVFKNNVLNEAVFSQLPDILPKDSLLVFNDTKVIHARLLFKKRTGATIEIFCLEPVDEKMDVQLAFQQKGHVLWKCFVGNNKRWDGNKLQLHLPQQDIILTAERKNAVGNTWEVDFCWSESKMSFAEVLECLGEIPLPPYLHREAEADDKQRYQTVYAKEQGSVAAPTAGLHFTPAVLNKLQQKGIETDFVTLHVGAGTFKPVSSENIAEHEMHFEQIVVTKSFLEHLLQRIEHPVIAVGTTSARTLESLYWHGVKLLQGKADDSQIEILQWDAYDKDLCGAGISTREALQVVLSSMGKSGKDILSGKTQMMIVPGYQFKVLKGLLTNFHQPKSTLLLLVSALLGGNRWKELYDYALQHDFRFLSYGDCCLLFPKR